MARVNVGGGSSKEGSRFGQSPFPSTFPNNSTIAADLNEVLARAAAQDRAEREAVPAPAFNYFNAAQGYSGAPRYEEAARQAAVSRATPFLPLVVPPARVTAAPRSVAPVVAASPAGNPNISPAGAWGDFYAQGDSRGNRPGVAATAPEQPTGPSTYTQSPWLAQGLDQTLKGIAAQQKKAAMAAKAAEAEVAKMYQLAPTKQEKAMLAGQLAQIRTDYARVTQTLQDNAKYASDAAQFYNGESAAAAAAARDQIAQTATITDGMTDTAGTMGGVAQVARSAAAADTQAAMNNMTAQEASWSALGNALSQASANALQRGSTEAALSNADARNAARVSWNEVVNNRIGNERLAKASTIADIKKTSAQTMLDLMGKATDARTRYNEQEAGRWDEAANREFELMKEAAKSGGGLGYSDVDALFAASNAKFGSGYTTVKVKDPNDANVIADLYQVPVADVAAATAAALKATKDAKERTEIWASLSYENREALRAAGIKTPGQLLAAFNGVK